MMLKIFFLTHVNSDQSFSSFTDNNNNPNLHTFDYQIEKINLRYTKENVNPYV